jgi:hypothetical protein
VKLLLIHIALLVSFVHVTRAQGIPAMVDSLYTVEASASGGVGLSWFRDIRSPLSEREAVGSYATLVRFVWHPSRLLTMGLITGYVMFSSERFASHEIISSDSSSPSSATLSAIPMQAAFSMRSGGFEIGAGIGPYFMRSQIQDEDYTIGVRLELGITGYASYQWTVLDQLRLGPELTIIYMGYRGILSVIPQVKMSYTILQY